MEEVKNKIIIILKMKNKKKAIIKYIRKQYIYTDILRKRSIKNIFLSNSTQFK